MDQIHFKNSSLFVLFVIAGLSLSIPHDARAAPSSACSNGPDGSERRPHQFFSLRVVDLNGAPLSCVELRTTHDVTVVTDAQGVASFFEPGLMNQRVHFALRRLGYGDTDYAGFDGLSEELVGVSVDVCEGGSIELVARESSGRADFRHPPLCTSGSWQSQLVNRPVPGPQDVFGIHVVDYDTGRGIPMVEVRAGGRAHHTDSNGLLAYYDASRMLQGTVSCDEQEHVLTKFIYASPGYETRAATHRVCHGGSTTIALKRLDVAQRLYRLTGAGIYRDSVILGFEDSSDPYDAAPIREPVLNSGLVGVDTASAIVFGGKIFWTFGDAKRIGGRLGNLRGTGAISELDGSSPDLGVDLTYLASANSDFVRPMVPAWAGYPGLAWPVGLTVVDDGAGESLFATIAFVRAGIGALGRYSGGHFVPESELSAAPLRPAGTTFRIQHADGDFVYRQSLIRHRATRSALLEPAVYEVFTPLCHAEASPVCGTDGVERDLDGTPMYRWRAGGAPVTSDHVEAGLLEPDEVIFGKLRGIRPKSDGWRVGFDVNQGAYNEFRGRFIRMVPAVQTKPEGISLAIYYAEADTPMGPWVHARRVLTVPQTMYTVSHLQFFDREDGRIFFVGTHSNSFGFGSLDPPPIPRYEYNQLMHALDLDDPRVYLPVPVYDVSVEGPAGGFVTRKGLQRHHADTAAAFFAYDRPAEQTVAVTREAAGGRLAAGAESTQRPLFFVLPATDQDGDGVADVQDSCLEVAGASGAGMRDPDQDGYGIGCDGDYNNDGAVDQDDAKIFRRQYGQDSADAEFDPNLDHDGDGHIGRRDWVIFRRLRHGSPGPSGLSCAGNIPCLPDFEDLVPVHEFVGEQGEYAYSVKPVLPGYARTSHDVGLVWRNPIKVAFPVSEYMR